jgi:Amt family ammonium transporter
MHWVGRYGFNAGSAVAADGVAANAFMTTTLAAAIAGLCWASLEWWMRGKPTVLGFCSGIVGGLVVITPAAGFVGAGTAVLFGAIAGIVTCLSVLFLKSWLKYDDALDTFGIHGVGGTLGALITGIFADPNINPNLNLNLAELVGSTLWIEQVKAMGLTIVLSVTATVVLAFIVKALVGWRPTSEVEQQGLDLSDHGESGYHYEENI